MKKDFRLGLEKLDTKLLLSSNPWFIDSIKAPEVWSQVIGSVDKPVVAIVDSGLDLNHSQFQNSLWSNPYDKIDGIDNDNNGYVDDIVGWDFVQNDNSPQDGLYHGTHVAGIVTKIGNGNISIMPLRFQNDSGLGYAGAAASAIHYAVDMKLKGVNLAAINCSFGGIDFIPGVLETAIRRANDNGIVVVIAAGNNGVDMDVSPKYPASLKLSNGLTVASINPDLSLASYSNYGKNSVHVAAPGSDIYSSLPNNSYGYVSGSSMAAPMVSAVVGLLKSLGSYSASQIKNVIMQGSGVLSGLMDKIGGGLVNVLKSWNLLKAQEPEGLSVVVQPPQQLVVESPSRKLSYGFDTISAKTVKGWANFSDNNISKPIVEVYVNNRLRYRVVANQYRYYSGSSNGFAVSLNRKFLKYGWNLIEIRIKDPTNQLSSIVLKKNVRR